jgi:hypothetical protein
MSTLSVPHLDPDTLDSYALGRLSGGDLAKVEEHLLLCGLCQERLQNLDEFIETLRLSVGKEEEERPRLLVRRATAG